MKLTIIFGVLFVVLSAGLTSTYARKQVPALYVFGDSLLDVGNNNYLHTPNASKVNFLPYGIDFPGSTPTGRFSNGYNSMDYIAMKLGFRKSPPPYLSFNKTNPRFLNGLHGANFASGGSGILDDTGKDHSIAMTKQIEYFTHLKRSISARLGPANTNHLLSRSMFVISAGANDMNTPLALHPQEFINTTIPQYHAHLMKLYDLGARKFAVVSVPLVGCTPAAKRQTNSAPNCYANLNALAQGFNNLAKLFLQQMNATLDGMKYSFCDAYNLVSSVIANPQLNGFTDVNEECCGFGEKIPVCKPNATYCTDRDKFVFWDGVHPTQAMAMKAGSAFYNGSPEFASPINLQQLAKE